jgi:hypothetical protein
MKKYAKQLKKIMNQSKVVDKIVSGFDALERIHFHQGTTIYGTVLILVKRKNKINPARHETICVSMAQLLHAGTVIISFH